MAMAFPPADCCNAAGLPDSCCPELTTIIFTPDPGAAAPPVCRMLPGKEEEVTTFPVRVVALVVVTACIVFEIRTAEHGAGVLAGQTFLHLIPLGQHVAPSGATVSRDRSPLVCKVGFFFSSLLNRLMNHVASGTMSSLRSRSGGIAIVTTLSR